MADWSRIVATTLKNHIPGETLNMLRARKLPAMAQAKGRFSFNRGGRSKVKRIRYRRGAMQGFAQGDTLSFPQVDRWKVAELGWRGYAMAEGEGKYERLVNKGREAIINHYAELPKIMLGDFTDNFAEEYYLDGEAAGNAKRFHGYESMLGDDGSPTLPFVANPHDSYMGLNTDLGNYGGTWSGTWPNGRGSAEYDFWSPLLVNYTDDNASAWEASEKLWRSTCLEALSFGIIQSNRSKAQTGMLDTIIMDRELYRQFRARLYEKQRINLEPNSSNSLLIKLGFSDVINWEGVDITQEYGITPGVAYGFNFDQMECDSLQGELFVPEGPDYDFSTKTYRFSLDCFGNFFWNPRYAAAWKAYG